MKINLRDYYPFYYVADCCVEAPEEVVGLLKSLARQEHAARERRRVHKVLYSLDATGIEKNIVLIALSPQEIYERQLTNQELYAAISSLPEKQAKRIYAHFFLGISKAAIARAEGVNRKSVCESIDGGLKNISIFLEKFS